MRACLSFKSQRTTPLSALAKNDELTLTLGDSLQSGCHSDSHSSFQFHYHQSVQIELCLHLSREQISTWDEHRWADPIPPCSSKSDPRRCLLTAEWHSDSRAGRDAEGRDVTSRRGFTPLIIQTSPLPSRRILQEKVIRLACIKTSSPCMSRPPPAQPVLCPRHTSETWLMPRQDF